MENLYYTIRDNNIEPGTEFYSSVHGKLLFLKLSRNSSLTILFIDTERLSMEDYMWEKYKLSDKDQITQKINELDQSSDDVLTFTASGHWILPDGETTPEQIVFGIEKIYKFEKRMCYGKISGIFVANTLDMKECIDHDYTVEFGEILGKYSNDECTFKFNNLNIEEVKSDLEDVIWFKKLDLEVGYNPLEYIQLD